MIRWGPPGPEEIDGFLHALAGAEFSYAEPGATRGEFPAGYDHDRNEVVLGHGEAVFERALRALRAWKMFPPAWTKIEPAGAPIQQGTTVAMLAHVFGLWWVNSARIVYTVDAGLADGVKKRCGFAYGTLPEHVETGEEYFGIIWRADDSVAYELKAFSRPRFWLVRAAYPVARRLQKRFVRDSQQAMIEAVRA